MKPYHEALMQLYIEIRGWVGIVTFLLLDFLSECMDIGTTTWPCEGSVYIAMVRFRVAAPVFRLDLGLQKQCIQSYICLLVFD